MASNEPENLEALLSGEKPVLQDVLMTPSFVQAVKTCNPQLNDYLLSNEIFPQVLDIALTDKAQTLGYSSKTVTNTMLFLTTNSNTTHQLIRENPLFVKVISEFIYSKYAFQSKIAGNFLRIVEPAIRKTNGEFLQNIPGLSDFLISNINVFAYMELFIILTTEFMIPFGVDLNMIKSVAKMIGTKIGGSVSSAIKQMLKLKRDLFVLFENDEVVSILVDEAIKPGHPLLSFKVFQILERILSISKSETLPKVIQTYSEKFNFDEHKDDYIKASAISLFHRFPDSYIEKLFDTTSLSCLNNSIAKTLPLLSDEKLIELNTKYNLIDRIMTDHIGKTNAHIWQLAEYLYGIQSLVTPKFRTFHTDILEPHLRTRNGAYGGERPREDSSDYAESYENSSNFVSVDIAILSDSSSSDTSSDEENDIGGYENAKFFAKLAGMDELTEIIDQEQTDLRYCV